jgi:(S)-2-hydroxyglutarate dehydrogenase
LKDFGEMITYPGFWKLGLKYYKESVKEIIRSFNKKVFVENARKLIPDIAVDILSQLESMYVHKH